MKMRQQQESIHISNINKQKALYFHNHSKGSLTSHGIMSMASSNYAVDYERDESPVSVISHSASVISQPSSACTSMEHHLILNPNLMNPKAVSAQRFSNPSCTYTNQEQISMGTSVASTSEDDNSAYNLPTLFVEVQEELSKAQVVKPGYTQRFIFRNSSSGEEGHAPQQINSTKSIKKESSITSPEGTSIAASLNSDDDEHMISIDLQGLHENPSKLRECVFKGNGNKLSKTEEKSAVATFPAKFKQYDEWKEDQKLERSTSHGQAALAGRRPTEPAAKMANFSVNHGRERSINLLESHEGESLKAQRNASTSIEKALPSLGSRQKSLNAAKVGVPSKWDDAEKWLCYDNNQHKAKDSPVSGQKLHSNKANLERGNLRVSKANNACKQNEASPNEGNLSGNIECKDNHALRGLMAREAVANHMTMQKVNSTTLQGNHRNEAMCRNMLSFASQSSHSEDLIKSEVVNQDDNYKRQLFGTSAVAWARDNVDYMSSSGEKVVPHVLSNKWAAISVSDGEIHRSTASTCHHHHASRMSISSGSTSGGESKTKDNLKTTVERWKKDESGLQQYRFRECDYMSSGELLRQASNHRDMAVISTSDGEMYANYTSNHQYKINVSCTQKFKQHQLLQKLRRKCSPSSGRQKAAAQHVHEEGPQNLVEKNGNGQMAGMQNTSRLSNIFKQASPQKDQCSIQGDFARSLSVGMVKKEEMREEPVGINAGMQSEFVVQTPTHGRSASMKDACTEVSPSLSRSDMGTQMTPSESSPVTSKCTSPIHNTSPARHNTPTRTSPASNLQTNSIIDLMRDDEDGINSSMRRNSQYSNGNALEIGSCHWAKLELRDHFPSEEQTNSEKNSELGSKYNDWSPATCLGDEGVRDEGVHEIDAVDGMQSGGIVKRLNVLDARAAAWEEAEKTKLHAKYKREEARINAWETLQKAKAESKLKKLEVKLERLRSRATEKVLSKVAAAERRAEEMRSAAEAQQTEQMRKVRERARNLRKTALFPGSFAVCFARNYMP